MDVIRSRSNELVQRVRKLAHDAALRRSQGRCVLLGERLIQDWLARGAVLSQVLIPQRWLLRPDAQRALLSWQAQLGGLNKARSCAWLLLEGTLADGIPGLVTDAAPIAVAAFHELEDIESLPQDGDILFFDGIQDPGNLGTCLRTAAAFGVKACIPGPGCADLWSPKTLRAAMGAHQRLSLFSVRSFESFIERLSGPIRAADAQGLAAHESDLRLPGLWVLGAEGRGLSAAIKQHPRVSLHAIPMQSHTESLNAAMAQGILLYEQYRQRQR